MATTVHNLRPRFDRMIAKSEEQTRAGNLPRMLRLLPQQPNGDLVQIWSVSSRTVAGEIRIVEVTQPTDGRAPSVTCDCPASEHCWHQVHVLRALSGEVPYYRIPERTVMATQQLAGVTLPAITAEDIFGIRY